MQLHSKVLGGRTSTYEICGDTTPPTKNSVGAMFPVKGKELKSEENEGNQEGVKSPRETG